MSENVSAWLKAAQLANMEVVLRSVDVVHTNALDDMFVVSPLLNSVHAENIDSAVSTPLKLETLSFWLNTEHPENMLDVLVSALVVVNVRGCKATLAVSPLLNTEQPRNIPPVVVMPVMSDNTTSWLNAAQSLNINSTSASALVVVNVRPRPPALLVTPLLKIPHPKNIPAIAVIPVVLESRSVWLNCSHSINI